MTIADVLSAVGTWGRREPISRNGGWDVKKATALVLGLLGVLGVPAAPAFAAEGATGFYLLGSKTSMAGYLPPPGTYLQDYNYYYSGSTDIALDIGGLVLEGGVQADTYYNLVAPIWVAPGDVLGGHISFLMLVPAAWKKVSAGASLDITPLAVSVQGERTDEDTKFGDLVPGFNLGWREKLALDRGVAGQCSRRLLGAGQLLQYRLQPLGGGCERRGDLAQSEERP